MIRLFTSYYNEPSPERKAELDTCLRRNIDHHLIDEVHVLCEAPCPESVVQHTMKARPKFADFFRIANRYAGPDDITIIANSDIHFDDTLKHLQIKHHEAYALTRWDNIGGRITFMNAVDSQDAWIFRGKIKPVYADFYMGVPGCDNRLAYELAKAGYDVKNPSWAIMAIHLHESNVRRYNPKKETVPGPYKLLQPIA